MDSNLKKVAYVTAVEYSFMSVLSNQAVNLRKQGYEVTAISSLEFPENREFYKKIGIPFIEVYMKRRIAPFSDLVSIFQLYRVFKREKFDIIHTQMPKATLIAAIAGRLAGIPVVNTARPFFREMPKGFTRSFFVAMERLAGRFTDLIMVENPLDYQMYLDLGIAKKDRLFVQGNGIDLGRFDAAKVSQEDKTRLRAELGIPQSARVIGIVARYVFEKGYLELFTAFKDLLAKFPDLYLLAAGYFLPSEATAVPQDLPRQMGIGDRVLLLQDRSDMEKIYSLMDIFVLPTHRDCFPRAMVEALAMSRPVVASDIPGCQVVIQDRVNGILVPAKNPKALAAEIERLLNDPALAKTLGENARQLALEKLDEQKICRQIADCYKIALSS